MRKRSSISTTEEVVESVLSMFNKPADEIDRSESKGSISIHVIGESRQSFEISPETLKKMEDNKEAVLLDIQWYQEHGWESFNRFVRDNAEMIRGQDIGGLADIPEISPVPPEFDSEEEYLMSKGAIPLSEFISKLGKLI